MSNISIRALTDVFRLRYRLTTGGDFNVATSYMYRVFLWNEGDKDWVFFDTTVVAAVGKLEGQVANVTSEHDGRKELARIAAFKKFSAMVPGDYPTSSLHTTHTLFYLEQQSSPVAGSIQFSQWDTTAKLDDQGMPAFIGLAEVGFQTKVTGHQVPGQRDAYVFQFQIVGGAEYNDAADMN